MDSASSQVAPVAGRLLGLVRRREASTRADLVRLSGLSRPTVTARVAALLEAGFLTSSEAAVASRGRPPEVLAFNSSGGYLLAGDVGGTHTRVAITDLAANVLEEREVDFNAFDGPEQVLVWVVKAFRGLLRSRSAAPRELRGIGLGLPGPVDPDGTLIGLPTMRGWDGVSVPEILGRHFAVPILVDRDVNIIALGEHRRGWPEYDDLVVVKVGFGLGLGLIVRGEPHRGALGAAGELAHLPRGGDDLCRCGNTGCLETMASGWALMQKLRAAGREVRTSADIVDLINKGDREAWRQVRSAGQLLGEVLADVVAVLNPAVLVVAGNLGQAHDPLLPVIREAVYRRCQPLTTRDLVIAPSRLGPRAGTIGAATMVHGHLFSDEAVSRQLGM